jgi:hypothetical protein
VLGVGIGEGELRLLGEPRMPRYRPLTGSVAYVLPLDQEKTVGETGLLIGDGIEAVPINLVELRISPVVDPAEVLQLCLVLGVWQGGAANVPKLGWERSGNGPLMQLEHDDRRRENWDFDGGFRLAAEVVRGQFVTSRVDFLFFFCM